MLDRGRWDVSEDAPARLVDAAPLGGRLRRLPAGEPRHRCGWWQRFWLARQADIGFTPPSWLSASLAGFAVAAALTLAVGAGSLGEGHGLALVLGRVLVGHLVGHVEEQPVETRNLTM